MRCVILVAAALTAPFVGLALGCTLARDGTLFEDAPAGTSGTTGTAGATSPGTGVPRAPAPIDAGADPAPPPATPPPSDDAGAPVVDASIPTPDACAPSFGAASPASYAFTVQGQTGWSHDEGAAYGWFHTYDALDVGAATGDAPHKVHVLLPRGYDACGAGYPVVYMNDGDTAFWNGGPSNASWHVQDALDALVRANAIPKVIVVAVVPVDRESEYTHAPYAPGKPCCGAAKYAAYLADRVKPFVDAHYRTLAGPATTAIVGAANGGLAAFYVATRHPETFGRAGCLSPSFWAGLDPIYGGQMAGGALADSALVGPVKTLLASQARRPQLWIDWGLVRGGGFVNDTVEAATAARGKEMVQLLEGTYGYTCGVDLGTEEDPAGGHDEASWARRFPEVMRALFAR